MGVAVGRSWFTSKDFWGYCSHTSLQVVFSFKHLFWYCATGHTPSHCPWQMCCALWKRGLHVSLIILKYTAKQWVQLGGKLFKQCVTSPVIECCLLLTLNCSWLACLQTVVLVSWSPYYSVLDRGHDDGKTLTGVPCQEANVWLPDTLLYVRSSNGPSINFPYPKATVITSSLHSEPKQIFRTMKHICPIVKPTVTHRSQAPTYQSYPILSKGSSEEEARCHIATHPRRGCRLRQAPILMMALWHEA